MHILYNNFTGEIVGNFSCPDYLLDLQLQNLPDWQGAIEYAGTFSSETHYFDLINTIRPRPEITAELNQEVLLANSQDFIIISGLPIPCTIKIDDQEFQVDDGEFEISTDMSGVYKITCEAWPHIQKAWEVEAV